MSLFWLLNVGDSNGQTEQVTRKGQAFKCFPSERSSRGRWKAQLNSDGRAGQTEGQVKWNPGQTAQLGRVFGSPKETISEYEWRRRLLTCEIRVLKFGVSWLENAWAICEREQQRMGWMSAIWGSTDLIFRVVGDKDPLVEIGDGRRGESGGYCVPGWANEYWLGGERSLHSKGRMEYWEDSRDICLVLFY